MSTEIRNNKIAIDAKDGERFALVDNGKVVEIFGGCASKSAIAGNRVQAGLARLDQMTKAEQCANGRNLRDYEPAPMPVWNIATVPFTGEHFATFPPELAERCILAGCQKNGVVLDPFAGSGTTGLVALRHSRKAVLIDINQKFMDIAVRRIKAEWHVPSRQQHPDFGPLFKNIPEAAE